jgi:preprotein translocase subunit SecB
MEENVMYPLQLLDVRLLEVKVKRFEPEEQLTEEHEENLYQLPLGIDVEVLKRSPEYFSVLVTLDIKGPDPDNPEFYIHFTLDGLFEASEDLEETNPELWEEFKQTSALTLLWPYAREYTQSFVRRMRVELPVLPTLNRLAMQAIASEALKSDKDD